MFKIFYHKGCNDGYFAAAAIRFLAKELNAIYVPVHHDALKTTESFSSVVSKDEVLDGFVFVDIAPSPELTIELSEMGYKVYIIDHHKTARKDFLTIENHPVINNPKLKIFIFNDLSGGALGYVIAQNAIRKGFKNAITFLDSIPNRSLKTYPADFINISLTEILGERAFQLDALNPFYRLICVRDLWLTEDASLKHYADALNAYLYFNKVYQNDDFDNLPVEIKTCLTNPPDSTTFPKTAVEQGLNILEVYSKQTEDDIRHSKKITYRYKGKDLILFIGQFMHTSLAGQMVRDLNPNANTILAVVKIDYCNPNQVLLSFRSDGVNCRKIAERMGGGGHDLASGAVVNLNETDTLANLINFIKMFVEDSMTRGLI